MTVPSTRLRIARATAWLAIPALALALSTSSADAHPSGYHRHGHGHGCGHARVYVRTPVPVRHYDAFYPTYAPYPAYVAPVSRPYPVVPGPYGSLVIDSNRGNVRGFVGLAGPNFSIGFGF